MDENQPTKNYDLLREKYPTLSCECLPKSVFGDSLLLVACDLEMDNCRKALIFKQKGFYETV